MIAQFSNQCMHKFLNLHILLGILFKHLCFLGSIGFSKSFHTISLRKTIYTKCYNNMYNHVKDWRSVKVPTPLNLNSTLSSMFAHGRQPKSLSVWLFGQQTTTQSHAKRNLYVQHMISYPSMHILPSKMS